MDHNSLVGQGSYSATTTMARVRDHKVRGATAPVEPSASTARVRARGRLRSRVPAQGRRAGRGRRTLIAMALVTAAFAGTTGLAVGNAQVPLTGPPPGTAAWRADRSLGVHLPDPAATTPTETARFFGTLNDSQREKLAERHPGVVGNFDGAPLDLRYQANRRALLDSRAQQQKQAASRELPVRDRQRARERITRYSELLAPGRRILAFDPRGRGQIAEVHGDLGTARHVSVIVPGSDIDVSTFDRTTDTYGTPSGMAKSLRQAAGGGTAVVAWAGYTTPVGIGPDAATGGLAEAGAPRLSRFVAGLRAVGRPAPTVFCHSYGSVVCGLAAPSLMTSDLVVLGSPGMRADSVSDLGTDARVWAAKDDSDWIGKVPNVRFLGLGHGEDPAGPAFGARPVPAHDAHGHTGYFAPGTASLAAFADIATGTGTADSGLQADTDQGHTRARQEVAS